MKKREFDWGNIAFLTLSPVAAFASVAWYVAHRGVGLGECLAFAVMYVAIGLAIDGGYHRYYSHRTYDCHPALQVFYLCFGAAALENSVLHWASDHRFHHRFVDTEQDPYNIMKGIFWAHMGWIFYKSDPNRTFDNIPDLKDDPLVRWQHRHYLTLAGLVGFGLPTLIGWAFGRPLGGLLFGGLLRTVVLQHSTFLINSAAHYFGTQPYSNKDSSRDNWVLAFFALGEGYHNYHHTFQGDYRNGIAWYHWDPTKWWIAAWERLGLTSRLNRANEWAVMKARMEMEMLRVRPWLERQPQQWRDAITARLEACRASARDAAMRAVETRHRYQAWAKEARANARREARAMKVQWARKYREAKEASDDAWDQYKTLLREFRRQPARATR